MVKGFLAYDLAIELYSKCETINARPFIKDQLLRASLSIALNLAEGSAKPSPRDQKRFYAISLGSLRETQALLQILKQPEQAKLAHRLGGMVYSLVHRPG